MDRLIEAYGVEARQLSWKSLAYKAEVENVSTRTIQCAMGTMDCRQCAACRKGWVSPSTVKNQLEFATIVLQHYPNPDDWKRIWFSDEVHLVTAPRKRHTLYESLVSGTALTASVTIPQAGINQQNVSMPGQR